MKEKRFLVEYKGFFIPIKLGRQESKEYSLLLICRHDYFLANSSGTQEGRLAATLILSSLLQYHSII